MSKQLEVRGVGRGGKYELSIYFNHSPNDDDVRLVHDIVRDGLARGDAYRGARDDMEIWKKRALEAEVTITRMHNAFNAENAPTHMGEPVMPPKPQDSQP